MRAAPSLTVGFVLALVAASTFGTSGVFARSLIEGGWSAEAAVTARIGIGALVLAGPAVFALRGRWRVFRQNFGITALFGVLAVAGAQVGFFNALRYLPVGVALLLEFSGIVLVVLWMWLAHGQRPQRLTLAGSMVCLAGLALVLDLTGAGEFSLIGLAWGMLAAVGLATYFVLSARLHGDMPSIAFAAGGMAIGAVILLIGGLVGLLELRVVFGEVVLAGQRTSWLVPVAGLSIIGAVIAYLVGIGAARILGARLSSFAALTEVLFAVLFAWLLLGELPSAIQGVGGLLILAGIVLVRLDSRSVDLSTSDAGGGAGASADPGAAGGAGAWVGPGAEAGTSSDHAAVLAASNR